MFDLGEIRNKLQGTVILFVEDDTIIRNQLVKVLEKMGMVVHTADDGRQGLEKAQKNNYSLILTDNVMPYMNGLEMAENLRKTKTEVPIIMISAFNHQGFQDECNMLNINAILVKPTSVNILLNNIIELIN